MGSALCGPARGVDKAMRCPCCGFESDNPEAFAVSLCWPCGITGNPNCENCVRLGVWVDRFSYKRGRGHRLRRVAGPRGGVTVCGLTIPYHDIGQATAVRTPCRRCWPTDTEGGDDG